MIPVSVGFHPIGEALQNENFPSLSFSAVNELKQGDPAKLLLGGKKEFGCKDDAHDELLYFP